MLRSESVEGLVGCCHKKMLRSVSGSIGCFLLTVLLCKPEIFLLLLWQQLCIGGPIMRQTFWSDQSEARPVEGKIVLIWKHKIYIPDVHGLPEYMVYRLDGEILQRKSLNPPVRMAGPIKRVRFGSGASLLLLLPGRWERKKTNLSEKKFLARRNVASVRFSSSLVLSSTTNQVASTFLILTKPVQDCPI